MRKSVYLLPALVLVCLLCAQWVMADPAPAPSAFTEFSTWGLDMLPATFDSGQLTYTVQLSAGAYLEYGGVQFPITQVSGFYAVNTTGNDANNLTATGPTIGEWAWDQNPTSSASPRVAGWLDKQRNAPIVPPADGMATKSFTFSQFSFGGTAPTAGYNITISIPQGATSPFPSGVRGNIISIPVPEPSGMVALAVGLMGLVGMASRRRMR